MEYSAGIVKAPIKKWTIKKEKVKSTNTKGKDWKKTKHDDIYATKNGRSTYLKVGGKYWKM